MRLGRRGGQLEGRTVSVTTAFPCSPEPVFLAGAQVGGERGAWCQEPFGSTWQIVFILRKCSIWCQFILCPLKFGNQGDTSIQSIAVALDRVDAKEIYEGSRVEG